MGKSETDESIPGVYAGTSLGVCLGSSDPSVGTPSINQKRVWDQSVSAFTAAADSRTGSGRTANSDLSGVGESCVCDAERRAAFAQLAGLFHGLETSAVLLKNAKGVTLVDPPRKAKGGLAGATTEMVRVHGQRDEYQRQECFGSEHGSSCEGFGESDGYPKLVKADSSTFVSREI